MTSPHTTATGTESTRTWTAPGNVPVTAERHGRSWRIVAGPAHLVGREYRTIAIARQAVKSSPSPDALLTTAEIAKQLGVTTQRAGQIAASRGIKPARVVGPAFLWFAGDLPRFERRPVGRPKGK